jgi:ribonuclease-3
VYYEAGFARAKEIVLETMGQVLDDIEHAPMKSAKQLLQEWAQGEKLPLPDYRMLEVSGPEHHRGFEVEVALGGNVARGTGTSKREAQEAAAAKLLELVTK